MKSDPNQAEQAPNLSAEASLIFLHNPVAAIVFDPATKLILRSNPAASRLYGYTEDELLGMPASTLLPDAAGTGPCKRYRKDGSEILLETSSVPIWLNGTQACLLFILDRTEAARTEQRLLSALAKAETALKSKSNFLSTMSHEMRTPLNGVIGVAGMLAETDLNAEQRDFLNTIRSSSEILLTVINDVLDYTKIEANKLTLEALDFDLPATIEDLFEMVGVQASRKGLSLHSMLAEDAPIRLRGDEGRLKQILLNLLSNALKFTETGSVILKVTREEPAGNRLRFQVIDTGIGISEEGSSQMFETFSQADSSITRRFGGTGLGLAISKRLATLMGGEIGLSSVPGQGSTFWFTAEFAAALSASPAETPQRFAGRDVLVVQRNQEERAHTRALLGSLGMVVTEAANAPHALSFCALRAEPFSFCLVDFNLPVIDGVKFAGLLKTQPKHREMPVILLVMTQIANQVAEAKEMGFADVLSKPLRKRQVLRSLSQAGSPGTSQANAVQQVKEPPAQATTAGRASILLVEDNTVNRQIAAYYLKRLGFDIEIAENGLVAVEAFERGQFDLILMDCHMPVMDGVTATKRIREMAGAGATIPILAVTADVFQDQRTRCLDAGMNDFLYKPITHEILKSKIECWLQVSSNHTS